MSNEIILAKGKVKNFNGEYWIKDDSLLAVVRDIKRLEGKTITLKAVIEDD